MIIPLLKPLPPAYADVLYEYFGERFGRGLDTACRNPDHLYFLPACPPDAVSYYQHFNREGDCFDGAFLREKNKPAGPREDESRSFLVGRQPTTVPPVDVATLPVSRRIKDLIRTGQGPYPSRSEAVFAVVQALIRAGLDDEQIASVLLDPDHRISDKPREKGIGWVRAEIARAWAKTPHNDSGSPSDAGSSSSVDKGKEAGNRNPPRKSQATELVELSEGTALFHDTEGTTYATLTLDGHREHWPVRSPAFRDWLTRRFWQAQGKAPSSQALTDALGVIDGQARFEGPEHPVSLRVGGQDGRLYLDLCDADWRVVEIDSQGWRLVSDPPVRFIRRRGMLSLPALVENGSLEPLWTFLNVNAEDRLLVLAWLVQALRDRGPYPILIAQGEQGTAKSGLTRCLRALIDPSVVALRTTPREERDLIIAARNNHVIAFDNLSGLLPWLSDAFCRLATGGGFSTRQLYTDTEEVLIQIQRPILLNGIDEMATRQDLIDRAIILNLTPIPETRRWPEAELQTLFDQARPGILGALLDAVAVALRQLPDTYLAKLPRLADFAL